jgi:hypothetical protein
VGHGPAGPNDRFDASNQGAGGWGRSQYGWNNSQHGWNNGGRYGCGGGAWGAVGGGAGWGGGGLGWGGGGCQSNGFSGGGYYGATTVAPVDGGGGYYGAVDYDVAAYTPPPDPSTSCWVQKLIYDYNGNFVGTHRFDACKIGPKVIDMSAVR